MSTARADPSPLAAAFIGVLGLAAGMGIGRFAFTPLLPLMQDAGVLSLQQGAWLASSNYAGYLAGALLCFAFDPAARTAARAGLVVVALSTAAMGWADSFAAWLAWRATAGAASAFVLVGMSSWALAALERHGRMALAGWVFSGVGAGIVVAGCIGLGAGVAALAPAPTWLVLGAIAALIAGVAWRPLGQSARSRPTPGAPRTGRLDAATWKLVACYGVFGFGYIIPATFLPALGRQLLPDPMVFGWAWPAFGLAGAASTVIAARWLASVHPRRLLALGLLVMAVGVLAPAVAPGLPAILLSALCVGGSFMVVTMAGFQDARAIAGDAAPRAVAAMTAAFAVGQLLGPLTVQSGAIEHAVVAPSILAAVALACSAAVLLHSLSGRGAAYSA